MKKILVTSGQAYTDIDALACAVAYAELLNLEGKEAEAVLPGDLNHSVSKTIRTWLPEIKTAPDVAEFYSVLVDTSHAENFAQFATEESIIEIYDHHFGHEEYWKEKLGENSHIDFIGACATLIWEQWQKRNMGSRISVLSANLLFTAIISNTLNFGAQLTNDRDKKAFKELKPFTELPDNWLEDYFSEQEFHVYGNIEEAIKGDTKTITLSGLGHPIVVAQMELWNSQKFLLDNQQKIKETMSSLGSSWIISLPSISEKINYLYTENSDVQQLFSSVFGARFENNIGKTDKLWLRKEIRKELYKFSQN